MDGIFGVSTRNTGFVKMNGSNISTTSNTQATYKKRLNLIYGFDQRRYIQMCVNPFCQGHSAGMTDNFFDGRLIDMCFGEQGNRGVPAAVRCMIDVQTKHQRLENIVVIHIIGKMLAVQSMDEIFTIRTVMKPALVKGEYFVSNRNLSNAVFGFAVNDIKILFGQMNIFFFQIQKL